MKHYIKRVKNGFIHNVIREDGLRLGKKTPDRNFLGIIHPLTNKQTHEQQEGFMEQFEE